MWKMFSSGHLNGYFTDHSLRRSGTTILFCTRIDRKLIKELTVHTSDMVDVYHITSENLKELMSKVMRLEPGKLSESKKVACEKKTEFGNSLEISVRDNVKSERQCGCSCKCAIKADDCEDIGKITKELVGKNKGSETTISLEIEMGN